MNNQVKDPLLWISILLAVTGTVQASTNMLTPLMTKYPTQFGLAMTGVSIITAVLTAVKTAIISRSQGK